MYFPSDHEAGQYHLKHASKSRLNTAIGGILQGKIGHL